tara:strand:+ start:447 stop:1259 length:813 start_codon:yes stop_codon:yes gene_type:complete
MKDKEGREGAVSAPLLEQVVTNQGKSELANQGRHNIGEANADNRCDHITNQISKKAWLIIGCILGATVMLGANSIRMHYSWSSDLEQAHKAFQQSKDTNRDLSLKYHKHREEREQGLRDKIDELHAQIELEDQKKKHLVKKINNFGETINRLVSNAEENKNKYLLAKETNLICVGAARNDVSMFHKAELCQEERTGKPFDIRTWNNMNILASVVIRLSASNVAKYFISQDGWREVVDVELQEFLESVAADENPRPIIIPLEGSYNPRLDP